MLAFSRAASSALVVASLALSGSLAGDRPTSGISVVGDSMVRFGGKLDIIRVSHSWELSE